MRATDIVRHVLDLLDEIEGPHNIKEPIETVHPDIDASCGTLDNRFKSILAMLDADSFGGYNNSPKEVVAPVSAVTTHAGGGINGPKHPHDIRVKDPSAYPDQQEY